MPCLRASRLWPRSLALLALLGACLLAAGCGDDSSGGRLLSQEQANDLLGTLSEVEQEVAARNCTGAGEQVATLESQLDAIDRLDRTLRRALRGSVRRLETLVENACDASTTAPTETTPTTPEPAPEGPTGATGAEGDEDQPKDEEPKEKQPKEKKNGKVPPGQQDEGGGAGLPGESNSGGNGG